MILNAIAWPNGARCACSISFDMDADSLIHIARPRDGFNRLYPITMGRYGPTVAVPRILETYRRLGLKQSFFIPAWTMQQYPDAVEAILRDGHEIGHHGFLHEDPTTIAQPEQRYWFEQALQVHQRMTGRKPTGYRAPVYNVTQGTVDLLVEHGFSYDSSLMADDMPYLMKTSVGELFEVPPHWGNDDWPAFAHFEEIGYMMPVRSPSIGLSAFFEEFEAHYEAGGLWMPVWHPFLTGRLARWRLVEKFLEKILASHNVWFAPLAEIVAHVDAFRRGGGHVRVEDLPYYDGPVALMTDRGQAASPL
ncbi:MAG: polysaccharide deacetylase [Mesorhizobium sp.]|nr:MAG: polysaccharide deacetylase [Mesorhizobium sp.]RWL23560.1 MAG: polysaccharide deacetylase [Mesorhizobium sp.]RWL25513.1 MAG: polysaccharide deacetylase [Mesorhizobium sp.]RWL33747.1 MAG: polysaccharide deacetylase [Mesorhizobium sp.]RWL50491.1 MAG: polysaccharide deacetylase [Mesorhizobium sp.]